MSIESLQQQLSAVSDPQIKQWSESYMKHTLPFRGLKQPQVRSIVLAWVKAEKIADQPWQHSSIPPSHSLKNLGAKINSLVLCSFKKY
jgi:DNA alkylation repair enzyme